MTSPQLTSYLIIITCKTCTLKVEKSLMKIMGRETNKWKDISCLQVWKLNIVKMSIQSKASYRFTGIHIKISVTLFTEVEREFLIQYRKTNDFE